MAIVLKCPDCGHTQKSDDGEPETCPECEGTMAPPAKKKYQAKSTTLEEESRGKKKSKARDEDEDDEEERPKAKKRAARRDDSEDDEDSGGDVACDGKAAKSLDLNPGFKSRALMKQVADELSRGEVLHYICRPSVTIAKKQGFVLVGVGAFMGFMGVVVASVMFGIAKAPIFAAVVPVIFVLIGIAMAIFGPIMKNRQAKLGWYAVTDRRAIVFNVGLWSKTGHCESYAPSDLRRMWVKKSFWVKTGGDLVFKTETTYNTRTVRDASGRTRTETTKSTQHYGFLGIEDVKDVETLIHEVLLSRRRRKDDDDEDD